MLSHTTNNQIHPAVAADSRGNFVVAWESNIQDGANRGIFTTGDPEIRRNTITSPRSIASI